MKGAGAALLVVGLILLFIAISMDTSVSTYVPSTSIYVPSLPSTVNNIGLLQQQMMTFQAGLAAILAGTMFLAGGLIVDAIKPRSEEEAVSPPPAMVLREQTPEEAESEARHANRIVFGAFAVLIGLVLIMALYAWWRSDDLVAPTNAVDFSEQDALIGNIDDADLNATGNAR